MRCKSSTVIYCGVIIYYCITYPGNSAAQQLEEEGKSLFCVQEILQSSKKERKLALLNNFIQIEQNKVWMYHKAVKPSLYLVEVK